MIISIICYSAIWQIPYTAFSIHICSMPVLSTLRKTPHINEEFHFSPSSFPLVTIPSQLVPSSPFFLRICPIHTPFLFFQCSSLFYFLQHIFIAYFIFYSPASPHFQYIRSVCLFSSLFFISFPAGGSDIIYKILY